MIATTPRPLIIGGQSTLGRALARHLPDAMMTTRHGEDGSLALDLANLPEDWTPPAPVSVAYLCAAVTNMQTCTDDPDGTRQVNVVGTLDLARILSKGGTRLVYPSTNTVFDGAQPKPAPNAPPCPTTEYGRQKAQVEAALLRLEGHFGIVRFSKVLTAPYPIFEQWKGDLMAGKVISPYQDLPLAPISLDLAVKALLRAGEIEQNGIFHLSADRDVSYGDIGVRLAQRMGVDAALVRPQMSGLSPPPPLHTALDCTDTEDILGISPPEVWSIIDTALK